MRTVLFGLDGATYTVLDPLIEAGIMPNLKAFREAGARCILHSTPHPITPQAWTSLATGRSMGHHGYGDFVRVEFTEQGPMLRFNTSNDNHCPRLWNYASDHDQRVTVLNYIGLAPPQPVNGHTMPGFVPGRHLKRTSYPRDLFSRLQSVDGIDADVLGMDLDIEKEALQDMPAEKWIEWIGHHIHREQVWFQTMEHLMIHEPADFTGIVFDGVDKIQHLAYRFLDPCLCPAEPSDWEQQIIDRCHDYFRQIDTFLGRTREILGETGRIFIASDHGFTATTDILYINTWLQQNGYLHWKGEQQEDDKESIVVQRLTRYLDQYDWSQTTAFALTPSSNGIYIMNVPEADYEVFREELIRNLFTIRAPDGSPMITDVKKREEWFSGPFMKRAPDLTLTLRDHGFLSVLSGREVVVPRSEPAGTHHPDGILMATGPGIRAGIEIEPAEILDVASLLVHSLGLPVPAEYEGEFRPALYDPDYLSRDPVRIAETETPELSGDNTGPGPGASDTMDDEDEAVLLERLRSLGYIE